MKRKGLLIISYLRGLVCVIVDFYGDQMELSGTRHYRQTMHHWDVSYPTLTNDDLK